MIADGFRTRKIDFVADWIFWNAVTMFTLTMVCYNFDVKSLFILMLAYYLTGFLALRSICASIYMAKYYIWDKWTYIHEVKK